MKHFLHCPWTGLGIYNGFRGNRWLKNRIKVFKQFVIPSLLAQTNKNFVLWCAWRHNEKSNPYVQDLIRWLEKIPLKVVHTFSGICFYDDKYPDDIAKDRLLTSIHGSMGELLNTIGDAEKVLMTIQPSDDVYYSGAVEEIQRELSGDIEGVGYSKGYIMNYNTMDIKEYNPTTNPPFYTIKFTRKQFSEPLEHFNYTAIKKDVGKYKAGTPIPSHEYVGDAIKYKILNKRGFLVGTHGENISTIFNHPFAGDAVDRDILNNFGLENVEPIKIKYTIRRKILHKLPPNLQRKLRYWLSERLFNKIYEFLRG